MKLDYRQITGMQTGNDCDVRNVTLTDARSENEGGVRFDVQHLTAAERFSRQPRKREQKSNPEDKSTAADTGEPNYRCVLS